MTTENNDTILKVRLEKEMRKSYLDYAMSVIVGRALPDARDGLKPVHRRVLYAMKEMGSGSRSPYKKSARIVGDTMGKYHPHGDQAIYDTMVRMAQDFSLRYPLVDGQGNFGSIDGDRAAAMRYTESRLATIADAVLSDLDEETVIFRDNYDGSLKEPTVLPGLLPGLLVNGSSGIAVGMATNMAPHNLSEVSEALNLLMDNPSISLAEIMSVLPGPDFPTGGTIMGRKGIFDAYSKGQGSVKMRGTVTHESTEKNEYLVVTEIPFMVQKNRLLEEVSKMVRERRIEGIRDIRDESNREGIRVAIDLRNGVEPETIKRQLYKNTSIESSFGFNTLAIVRGKPELCNLKDFLTNFLTFREDVVIKKTRFDLKKAEDRAHILIGLSVSVENLDKIIKIIRSSKTPDDAKKSLLATKWKITKSLKLISLVEDKKVKNLYSLSDPQVIAILELRLQRLTGMERNKLEKETRELSELIN